MCKLEPIYLLPHREPLGGSGVRTETACNAALSLVVSDAYKMGFNVSKEGGVSSHVRVS